MGVHGLWKLLEASGKPVPLESLDNKVLAVDVSIWLHQLVKGFQDSKGSPLPNAHLLGLFHRVCKLLFYRIKPVFVFDGGVPLLKRQTIAARKKLKTQASQDAALIREKLLKNLIKRKAVRRVLQGKESLDSSIPEHRPEVADMFHLPTASIQDHSNSESESEEKNLAVHQSDSDSDSEVEFEPRISPQKLHGLKLDLHTLDVKSEEFLSLPPDVRHDILSDLQETRKQNSWGRLHEMPEESSDFSSFQLGRLIKRRNVQVSLKEAEKEMGGKVLSLNELQDLMSAQGVNIVTDETSHVIDAASKKIASDAATRYLLLKESSVKNGSSSNQKSLGPELEEENMLKTSKLSSDIDDIQSSLYNDDWSSDEDVTKNKINNEFKEAVMSENDDLSQEQILALIQSDLPAKSIKSDNAKMEEPSASSTNIETSKVPSAIAGKNDSICLETEKEVTSQKEGCLTSVSVEKSLSTSEVSCSIYQAPVNDLNSELNHEEKRELKDAKGENVADSMTHRSSQSCDSTIFGHKGQEPVLPLSDTGEEIELPSGDSDSDDFEEVACRNSKASSVEEAKSSVKNFKEDCDVRLDLNIHPGKTEEKTKHSNNIESIEIIVNPTGDAPINDIFADIFYNPASRSNEEIVCDSRVGLSLNVKNKYDKENSSDQDTKPESTFEPPETSKLTNCLSHIESKEQCETSTRSNISLHGNEAPVTDVEEPEENSPKPESEYNTVISDSPFSEPLSPTQLQKLEDSLEVEQLNLQTEKGRQERLAANITEQMCSEAQELLQLFGLPFIVAPLEAEAQCAFLDAISLTEGSITDDSDIWLFGGKKVYKNFFNQKKHVLQYTLTNIQNYFKLSREQLVQLALLVGSDYTVGLQGVGPVTALEILAAFSSKTETEPVESSMMTLQQFRKWCKAGFPPHSPQKQRLGKKLKNVKIADGFPNQAVVEAYLKPTVDDSRETFSWGTLDLPALRDYTRSKFGWTAAKTDEIILPVSKRWSLRTSQRSIDSYFNLKPHLVEGLSKISKRVQRAIHTIAAQEEDESNEDVDDVEPLASDDQKKTRKRKSQSSSRSSNKTKAKRNKDITSHERDKGESSTDNIGKVLPVRAPTVPRNRTSLGVKRVGVKRDSVKETLAFSVQEQDTISEPNKVKTCSGTNDVGSCLDQIPDSVKPRGEKLSISSLGAKYGRKAEISVLKRKEKDDAKDPTATQLKTSQGNESSVMCHKNSEELLLESLEHDHSCEPSASTSGVTSISKCVYRKRKQAFLSKAVGEPTTLLGASNYKASSSSSSDEDISTPNIGNDMHNIATFELEAVSALDWEEDPWEDKSTDFSDCPKRQKLYFGGIRPNKPSSKGLKPPPRQQSLSQTAASSDSRGMRPGWRTEQQLQSRDVTWMEAVQAKKEEVIPQRERDRRATEQAKMKAIRLIKAADSHQASRILGGTIRGAKRGRRSNRSKPTRKELPEHNLSESSSDE